MTDNPAPAATEPAADDDPQGPAGPWTVEELSAGLESLANDLEALESQIAGSLEELEKSDVRVQEQVAQLKAQFDELLKQKREREIEPRPWPDRVDRADWEELVEWVDWLQRTYEFRGEYTVHPCWPAHPGVVQELAGLYHSWRAAQLVDEISVPTIASAAGKKGKRPGSNDITAWHDRWLWPFLNRIKGGHYRLANCTEGHEIGLAITAPTDPTFLPLPSAARAADGDELN